MTLKDYLAYKRLRAAQFSRIVGVRRSTLNAYLNHGRPPEFSIMLRIITATGGMVTPNDFYLSLPEERGFPLPTAA